MGLLKDFGKVFQFKDSEQHQQKLKLLAALQFLEIFNKYQKWQSKEKCCFIKWGDEIEGHRIHKTEDKGYVLFEKPLPQQKTDFPIMVEYGRWMFELIPWKPFLTNCNLEEVISSTRSRYGSLKSLQGIYLTIPAVPFLGTTTKPEIQEGQFRNEITQSKFFSDSHICQHPRFGNLTRNIRQRRGSKVQILVPIFKDKNTNLTEKTEDEPFPGKIYMDAMGFGMGMACLQTTFGTKNITQARYLHDMLHVLSPLLLSLTAGTSILKGKLSDWDVRWKIIEDSVDDRTPQERDPTSPSYQPKSRYSSMSHFIWNSPKNLPQYSDLKVGINEEVVELLKSKSNEQIDPLLARHLGFLTSRDFLVMHEKFLELTPEDNYLFEMVNSTNWNSIRFKAPINEETGWRVEFRTMEIQLTADENSVFSLMIYLIVKLLNEKPELNFYMPITLIDQNFKRAHERDSINFRKFLFRTNIFDDGEPKIAQLTLKQIFFGAEEYNYPGIFKLIRGILQDPNTNCPKKKECIIQAMTHIQSIQDFIKERIDGKRMTLAQWMRHFVINHKSYKFDSCVGQQIMTDLLDELAKISKGQKFDSNFHNIFKV